MNKLKKLNILYFIIITLLFLLNYYYLKNTILIITSYFIILIAYILILILIKISNKEYYVFNNKINKKNKERIIRELIKKYRFEEESIISNYKYKLFLDEKNLNRLLLISCEDYTDDCQKELLKYCEKFLDEGKWNLEVIIFTVNDKTEKSIFITRFKSRYNERVKNKKRMMTLELDLLTNNGFLLVSVFNLKKHLLVTKKFEYLQHNSFFRFHHIIKKTQKKYEKIINKTSEI